MMPVVQSACSCFHCTVNHTLAASGQVYMLQNHHHHHHPPIQLVPQPGTVQASYVPNTTDRTHYLRESVFSLVYENCYLALTDSKLLGWYLALSLEDRKIIQDQGGFHHFLKQHPALELSKHHIYVKNVPQEPRQYFPSHSSSYNSSNQHCHTSFNSPTLQRFDSKLQELTRWTLPMANCSGYKSGYNAQHVANLSLDMELEKQTQSPSSSLSGDFHHVSGLNDGGHVALSQNMGHDASLKEDYFYSILEADNNIVLCVPKETPDTSPTLPGNHGSKSKPFLFKSTIRTTVDRATSPIPSVCTCDAGVGTEQRIVMSTVSQTETPSTAHKHLNTEVHMIDLEYLTKEFITIKNERDELLEKAKMQRTPSPKAKMIKDLKKLEADYYKMREKIISGVSLKNLKALPFDALEEVSSNAAVTKFIGDNVLAPLGSQSQDNAMAVSENRTQPCQTNGYATGKDPCKMRAVARVRKDGSPSQRTESKAPDLNSNETWYDAEEDLPSKVSRELPKEDKKANGRNVTDFKPKFMSTGLCVSGLPRNTTKKDVVILFKKYGASEVHIFQLKELCVAIVTVESQSSAEAAVKELNGLKVKGYALHVEHISTGEVEDQEQLSLDEPESSISPNKNQLAPSPNPSPTKRAVCVSPTAQGTFVPQHYGTMGSFDILMSELTQRHPNVGSRRIVDALLALRARYRGVLSGLPLRTICDMTSDLLI